MKFISPHALLFCSEAVAKSQNRRAWGDLYRLCNGLFCFIGKIMEESYDNQYG